MDDSELPDLGSGYLDSVCFVQDYVEFRIDYNVFRCFTGPTVAKDGKEHRFPEEGATDALRSLIGSTVVSADYGADQILLKTDLGHSLSLPLDHNFGPECVHFVPADERGRLQGEGMWIW